MFEITPETPDDLYEVELLLDTAFAPGRATLSSYRLRDGVEPVQALCLVARDTGADAIIGCIRYWPVRIGEAESPALLLGPVAAHPTRQGEGIGGILMLTSLERARDLGWRRVVLVGDEPYYQRMGFTRAAAEALDFPPPTNPNRLLARALDPEGMTGVSGMVHKWTPDPSDVQ